MRFETISGKAYFASIVAVLAPVLGAGAAALAQVEHTFEVEAAAGVEYDDNITVTQIDTETGQDDFSAVFDLDAAWEMEFGDSDSLELGYVFNFSQQFDLTEFDIELHGGTASYEHDFENFSAGLDYQIFYTKLGGEGFLTLNRINPYVTFFPAKSLFVRAGYIYKDKALKNRIARDAETNMFQVDSFVFLDGAETFLGFKYRLELEDAVGPEFDFDAHIFEATLFTRLPFGGEKNRLKISGEYEARDYENITPSIGEIRDDDRFTFAVEWEVPLGKYLFANAEYRYRDFSSNLPSADYTENVVQAQLGVKF